MEVEISHHACDILIVNKPFLGNFIEHSFTIKGLSLKSRKCTKIEHLFTNEFMKGEGLC